MPLYSLETQGQLHPFLTYEWLLTNGCGAFASSSVVGCNRRRYHGLLCAATKPPLGRMMTLNRIGELLYVDGRLDEFHELSISQFRSAFHPRGDHFLRRFELDRVARWEYLVAGVRVTKELQIVWRENKIGVRYTVQPEGDRQIEFHLLPFVSMRDFHSLRRAPGEKLSVSQEAAWSLAVNQGEHTLHFRADAGQFVPRSDWWYSHTYAMESERGLDDTEDLFVPGELIHKTHGAFRLVVWASLSPIGSPLDFDAELAKRPEPPIPAPLELPTTPPPSPSLTIMRLARAAADFVVSRSEPDGQVGTTIIAGYPWFADWGRDTMIALPGLLLTTGRYTEAAQVLCVFAKYVSEGMIPNRFDDYTNEPSYNTVDASLWFIHACFEYLRCSKDSATFEGKLLPACRAIVQGYRQGTRYNIHMDPSDGLIVAGDKDTQLTWMDAKCNGIAFTPRHGKAVEVNALWYNALMLLGETDLADKVRKSFKEAFWLNAFRGLADVIAPDHRDTSIRPNQIFAVSLPHSPLDHDQQHAVVEVCRRELLTPFGLRTLAKSDPQYHGRYSGPPMQRDRAYHNGTVWVWLIGHFLDAHLRAHRGSPDAARQARVWLQPLIDNMNQGSIGQLSECFEGDEPHRAVGAPAQAWSVAEVLRLAVKLGL